MTVTAVHGLPAFKGRSYHEIEGVALRARAALFPGLPLCEPFHALPLFEALDRQPLQFDDGPVQVTYAVEEYPAEIEAETRYDSETRQITVTLSAQTYEELEKEAPRARFSLCHELGHVALHREELEQLGRIPFLAAALFRSLGTPPPKYKDTEWQANAFSAALLMPAYGLVQLEQHYGTLNPNIIETFFMVSPEAAEIRLKIYTERKEKLLKAL